MRIAAIGGTIPPDLVPLRLLLVVALADFGDGGGTLAAGADGGIFDRRCGFAGGDHAGNEAAAQVVGDGAEGVNPGEVLQLVGVGLQVVERFLDVVVEPACSQPLRSGAVTQYFQRRVRMARATCDSLIWTKTSSGQGS